MHNFGYAEEGQQERVGDARLWWRIVSYCSEQVGALTAAVLKGVSGFSRLRGEMPARLIRVVK